MGKIVGFGQTGLVARMQKASLFGYEPYGRMEGQYSPYAFDGYTIAPGADGANTTIQSQGLMCPDNTTLYVNGSGLPKCAINYGTANQMDADPIKQPYVPPIPPPCPNAIPNPNPAAPNPWLCPPDPNLCVTGPWVYNASTGAWDCTGVGPTLPTCTSSQYAAFVNGKWVCLQRATPAPPPPPPPTPPPTCPDGTVGEYPDCKPKTNTAALVAGGTLIVAAIALLVMNARSQDA